MNCSELKCCEDSKDEFAGCVFAHDVDGGCQFESVSENSPGPVENNEILLRFVFKPHHLDDDELNETLFSDCFKCGASCNRGLFLDVDHLHKLGYDCQNEKRKYIGFVRLNVGFMRDSCDNGIRVYDTALPYNKCHADVVSLPSLPKTQRKKVRMTLLNHVRTNGGVFSPDCPL